MNEWWKGVNDRLNSLDDAYYHIADLRDKVTHLEAVIKGLEFDLEQSYLVNERLKQLPAGERQ